MTSSPDIELQELELLLNSIACEIQGLGLIEEQELEGDKSPSKNSPNESYVISIPSDILQSTLNVQMYEELKAQYEDSLRKISDVCYSLYTNVQKASITNLNAGCYSY